MQETRVRSPGQEEPLEKEMATHSSIFAWEIPWTEKPGWLQSMGSQRVGHNLATKQQQDPAQPKTKTKKTSVGAASTRKPPGTFAWGGPCHAVFPRFKRAFLDPQPQS